MIRKVTRTVMVVGLLAGVAGPRRHGELRAAQRPPQVIQSGFESTDSLLKDVERAEKGPLTQRGSSRAAGS